MEPDYLGPHNNYWFDIAVIVLKTKVIISKLILPICIDWTNKNIVSNGSVGKVNWFYNNLLLLNKYFKYYILKNLKKIIRIAQLKLIAEKLSFYMIELNKIFNL